MKLRIQSSKVLDIVPRSFWKAKQNIDKLGKMPPESWLLFDLNLVLHAGLLL